jgi:arylsulfatase A-like enzyme
LVDVFEEFVMRLLLLVLAALIGIVASALAAASERPNILLITADDLGNQLSCYGDHRLQTPRLDQLSAQGVRFTRAFVTQSSCSSSRSSILTGLYLFTEMNFHTANMYRPQRTVRDDRYKLLLDLAPSADQAEIELYDLQNDPGETNNLAADPTYADRRQRLEAALHDWRQRTDDPLLDAARLRRWTQVAAKWNASAPRLDRGPRPDVAEVPPGELELLK